MRNSIVVASRGRNPDNPGGCDNALTINSWWHQNFIMEYEIIPILRIKEATKAGFIEIHPGECFDAQNINSETRR